MIGPKILDYMLLLLTARSQRGCAGHLGGHPGVRRHSTAGCVDHPQLAFRWQFYACPIGGGGCGCTHVCFQIDVCELCAAFYEATAVNQTTIACPAADICQPLSADQLQAGHFPNAACTAMPIDQRPTRSKQLL